MKGLGKSSYVFQMRHSTPEYFNLNSELAHVIIKLTNWLQLFTIATKVGNFSGLFSENLLDLISYC